MGRLRYRVSEDDLRMLYKSGYLIEKKCPLPNGDEFVIYGENPDKPYESGLFEQFFESIRGYDIVYIRSSGQDKEDKERK